MNLKNGSALIRNWLSELSELSVGSVATSTTGTSTTGTNTNGAIDDSVNCHEFTIGSGLSGLDFVDDS